MIYFYSNHDEDIPGQSPLYVQKLCNGRSLAFSNCQLRPPRRHIIVNYVQPLLRISAQSRFISNPLRSNSYLGERVHR